MRFRARNAMAVALAATAIVTMTGTAAEAKPADCATGEYCAYDGSLYEGEQLFTGTIYMSRGEWYRFSGVFQDKARSIWNAQTADDCHNGAAKNDPDPFVYFSNWTPSGVEGALFFTDGNRGWADLKYYRDKIDAEYNRCNSAAPSYIPRDA